jgi:hypothetical protein
LFGTKLTLSTGEEVEYTPGCLHDYKNPCTRSNCTKDLDEYKLIVGEFDELLAKYKKDIPNLLKRITELEVSHRKMLLQTKQIKFLADFTFNCVISELAKLKSTNPKQLSPIKRCSCPEQSPSNLSYPTSRTKSSSCCASAP